MNRISVPVWMFAPLGALIVLAGYLGYRLGQPVSETEIITHFAAIYVAEAGAGAAMTDCLAVAGQQDGVRLVVVCEHPGGEVYRYPAGPRGQLVSEAQGELA